VATEFASRLDHSCERANERNLILDDGQTTDRADQPQARVVERAAGYRLAGSTARAETLGIDAIHDAHDSAARNAHRLGQIILDLTRKSHVLRHEGPVCAPRPR
jgi:hypothetical protein